MGTVKQLASLALVLLAGCGGSRETPLPAQIEAVFREAHADGFNGSVLVTRGGAPLYQGNFGLADEERGILNERRTRFLVFSVTKPMTAVLTFQLVEAGKLRLDQTLDQLFENLAGNPVGAISIEQLLSHTSGIDDVLAAHLDRRITPQDLESAQVSRPGRFAYSSAGFVVLALVLERVSGLSYAELLDARVLRPAGMLDTGVLHSGVPVERLARGHRRHSGKRRAAPLELAPEVLEGAGSVYTTVDDLARFDHAIASGKLLSPASQQRMFTQVSDEYAHGWSLGEQGGQYFPWHAGSFRGYAAVFVRQVHRGEMIAILSNDHEADVLGLRTQVLRLLKRAH